MARIGPKNTKPEMLVRRLVHAMGYRYRLHAPDLPGRPDLAFRPKLKAIFVHGCYWHRHDCRRGRSLPSSNTDKWNAKFKKNAERDSRALADLKRLGWKVLVVWQCQTRDTESLCSQLRRFLHPDPPGHHQTGPKQ